MCCRKGQSRRRSTSAHYAESGSSSACLTYSVMGSRSGRGESCQILLAHLLQMVMAKLGGCKEPELTGCTMNMSSITPHQSKGLQVQRAYHARPVCHKGQPVCCECSCNSSSKGEAPHKASSQRNSHSDLILSGSSTADQTWKVHKRDLTHMSMSAI